MRKEPDELQCAEREDGMETRAVQTTDPLQEKGWSIWLKNMSYLSGRERLEEG